MMGKRKKRRIQEYILEAEQYISSLWVQPEAPASETVQDPPPADTIENTFGNNQPPQEAALTEDVNKASESDETESENDSAFQYDPDGYYCSVVKETIESVYEEEEAKPPSSGSSNIRYSLGDFYDFSAVSEAIESVYAERDFSRFNDTMDKNMNLTFTEKLQQLIQEKGLQDPYIYKAANLDRRLFSKIMNDPWYSPSKDTVLAIAFAMRLTFDEANDLLSRAGYSLSHSTKRDIVIEYFFRMHIWKLQDINIVLSELGERIIGRY